MTPATTTQADVGRSAGGLEHRAPRLLGPGDRVRGESGASLKVLLYGSLADVTTRHAYRTLREATKGSPHVCFAMRHAGPVVSGSFHLPVAVEAAAAQGMYWAMCDRIVDVSADPDDLVAHLLWLCLDLDQARSDIMSSVGTARLRGDADLATRADPAPAPLLFLNGTICRPNRSTDELGSTVSGLVSRGMPLGQRPW